MSEHFSVSGAARELSAQIGAEIRPRDISQLFYQRLLRDDLCPLVGGRRIIPAEYLPQVLAALRRAGHVRKSTGAAK